MKKLAGSGWFGHSVATSGDTVAVGAPESGNLEGEISIFYRDLGSPDNWGLVTYRVANDRDG